MFQTLPQLRSGIRFDHKDVRVERRELHVQALVDQVSRFIFITGMDGVLAFDLGRLEIIEEIVHFVGDAAF
jgi:hypothetical protein